MSGIRYPASSDLRDLVRFCSQDGSIWLAEHRMLLLHGAALRSLRMQLIDAFGSERAREVLSRMGYAAGLRDAELVKQVRYAYDPVDAFLAGPQLHTLEGTVTVRPVRVEIDLERGHFEGEFIWLNSLEADLQLREGGPTPDPACWMQLGYASGYTSGFMGQPVRYAEVECAAAGHGEQCRIVGKLAEAWVEEGAGPQAYDWEVQVIEPRVGLQRCSPADTGDRGIVLGNLLGQSNGFRRAVQLVERAASTQVTVLLLGETGVGKERFARALHGLSARAERPFVAVNCAALPHDLIEAELFGVEKGAYTGAHAPRPGRFERADSGTLFLDEVGELPPAAQAKLLRVVQEGEVERVGSAFSRKVNVRLVAATNRNLQDAVAAGDFRADLFYRLNVYPVTIPPLRKRGADIAVLAHAMVRRLSATHGRPIAGLSDGALQALRQYSFPGNVRELENLIERGVILAPENEHIAVEHLFGDELLTQASLLPAVEPTAQEGAEAALCRLVFEQGMSLEAVEELLLVQAVERAEGNLAAAARTLGMTRPQLSYRLKKIKES